METILIILWILCGLLSVSILLFSARKDWYDNFEKDYFKSKTNSLYFLYMLSMPFAFGGLISLIMSILTAFTIVDSNKSVCIYFKIPKKD